MAGESAREVARRRREKAERLARDAEAWEKGAVGEEVTAAALAALPAEEWTVFHDLRWPGRRHANIDHVVVGPGGVFVVDSKNWSGRVEVVNDVLRRGGRSREKAVVGVAEAAIAVTQMMVPMAARHAQPVLCFVGDDDLTGWSRDVMVCSTSNLTELVLSRTPVLSREMVREIAAELDARFRAAAVEESTPHVPHTRQPGTPMGVAPTRQRNASPRRPRKRTGISAGAGFRFLLVMTVLVVVVAKPELLTSLFAWFSQEFFGAPVD